MDTCLSVVISVKLLRYKRVLEIDKEAVIMELLYVKSKEPLILSSYIFDSVTDAAAYYTQNSNKQIFVGFFDEKENKLITFAENESEIDLYINFVKNVINANTRVSHIFEDSSFAF